MTTQLSRYAGWAAYLSAAFVALDLLISIGLLSLGLFVPGPRSHSVSIESFDVMSSFTTLLFALALYPLFRSNVSRVAQFGLVIGIVGGIYLTILHTLFVFEVVWFSDAIIPFLLGIAASEVWLLTASYLARPRDKPLLGIVMTILAMSFIGYPVWAIWLGRRLLTGPVGLPNLESSVN